MGVVDRIVGLVTGYSKTAIAVMVVLTVAVGAGAPMVDQSSSLEQFQSDTPEAQASSYVESNFSTGPENTTFVQVIVRGGDVLSKEALVSQLEFQQEVRREETVGPTLVNDSSGNPPSIGVANVLALASIQSEIGTELRTKARRLEELNATLTQQRAALEANASRLQQRRAALNETVDALGTTLQELARDPNASVRPAFDRVNESSPIVLGEDDFQTFSTATRQLRTARNASARERATALGTRGVLRDEFTELEREGQRIQEQRRGLQSQGQEVRELGEEVQQLQADLGNASSASLDRQIEQLESLSDGDLADLIDRVLSEDSRFSSQALRFMPSVGYDPGEALSNATMILLTQTTESQTVGGTATPRIERSQLAITDVGAAREDGLEYLVFGVGIISEESTQSMSDSLAIVGPLALVFVFLALALAYRDVLDIVLGLAGIAAVLTWTFGFMGWLGITFNQIFISVPVLLIGLSIDYAIHIFMRHREERAREDDDLRVSMRTALAGVGVALALVTATTVIGFMSNIISPLPPIQEFGIVSSFGIVAAFLVFSVLTPALKVEIDGFLESRGIDRTKRAIGTGGGRFSSALKLGWYGARKSALGVIVLALVVSAAGAYGATQVDTSFQQEDFLADDPPDWMKDLPDPFAPGDYSAKANLEFVSERFQQERNKVSILVRGDVTADGALDRIHRTQDAAGDAGVTYQLSSGQASITSPLSVINATRQRDAPFNETIAAADTDGDMIPDTNLTGVYDHLFEVSEQAGSVLYRTEEGSYEAARLVVDIEGTAASSETLTQMRDAASVTESDGLRAIAAGQPIEFEIVQRQLLDTVIESLLVTLVAVIAFLALVYRVFDDSATLGFVTLVPVVLSVAWILGTMYLIGMPFNVLTGTITSLTVGLGVAYSIHISERYNQELERNGSAWDALGRAVTGTGGALLGSAATTVGGFGTLAFALLPALQQFGIITGLTIIYAFMAAVLVLPSLLVVWTRFVGPAEKLDVSPAESAGGTVPTDD